MSLATMTSKGQVTIPKIVREKLGLHTGDKIDFKLEEGGTARILPVTKRVSEVFGVLSSKSRRAVSVEEMHDHLRASFRDKGK